MTLLLGLDLGTTTIKAAAYDTGLGRVVSVAARPTPTTHPAPGYSEHDPEALWQTVAECLREIAALTHGRQVGALAIASFAEAGLPLDRAGRPLYPIIAWYDRRCEPQAAWWEQQIEPEALHAIAGQNISPSFGVNKLLWIREHEPALMERMATWLSAPDYILWRMTGERATDYSLASRTLLFDQRTRTWSGELLRLAGLDASLLPQPLPAGTLIGKVTPGVADTIGVPAGTPCVLGGHDHLCASLAAGAHKPGAVIDSCGTAEALLFVLPAFSSSPGMVESGYPCYAHVVPGLYVLKGGLKAAGGAVEWLARQLAGPDSTPDALPYETLLKAAEPGVGVRAGPIWLPHLIGSGTPEGDRHSLAAMIGVRAEHDRGDLFRGLLESLAFWLRHNLEHMADLTGQDTDQVVILGGTLRLGLLTQLKADVLGQPVTVPELPEAAATGAALLAGLGTGIFTTPAQAVGSLRYGETIVKPCAERIGWYDRLYRTTYRPLYGSLAGIHHILEAFQ